MHFSFPGHFATRLEFIVMVVCALSLFVGCRSTSTTTTDSPLQSTATDNSDGTGTSTAAFQTISETEFFTMRGNVDAEFLGCICVSEASDREKWVAWQFLNVGDEGYRTATDQQVYGDLEACVSMRETLMECEG